jgi:hypothetical protein
MDKTMKAKEMIKKLTDKELLKQWKLIDRKPMSQEVATVRGWLMDELEERFPDEFSAWLEDLSPNADITDYL